jgi:hypothetical protein
MQWNVFILEICQWSKEHSWVTFGDKVWTICLCHQLSILAMSLSLNLTDIQQARGGFHKSWTNGTQIWDKMQ